MASRLALPYYAPDLPSALPTEEKIDNGSDLREYCFKGRRVVVVKEHYIVKYGLDVNLLEWNASAARACNHALAKDRQAIDYQGLTIILHEFA